MSTQPFIAPDEDSDEPYLASVDEASRLLGLSRTTIYALIETNELETRKVGRRRLILRSSIRAFAFGE